MKTLTLILIVHVFLIYSEAAWFSRKKKNDNFDNGAGIEDDSLVEKPRKHKSKGHGKDKDLLIDDDNNKDFGEHGKKNSKKHKNESTFDETDINPPDKHQSKEHEKYNDNDSGNHGVKKSKKDENESTFDETDINPPDRHKSKEHEKYNNNDSGNHGVKKSKKDENESRFDIIKQESNEHEKQKDGNGNNTVHDNEDAEDITEKTKSKENESTIEAPITGNNNSATEVPTDRPKEVVLPPEKPQNDTSGQSPNNIGADSQTKQPTEVLTPLNPDENCPDAENHTEVILITEPPGVQNNNSSNGGVHKLVCYWCTDTCQVEMEEKCTERHDRCYHLEYEGGYVEKGCIMEQHWNYTFEKRHEVHGGPTDNSYRCEGNLCNNKKN